MIQRQAQENRYSDFPHILITV